MVAPWGFENIVGSSDRTGPSGLVSSGPARTAQTAFQTPLVRQLGSRSTASTSIPRCVKATAAEDVADIYWRQSRVVLIGDAAHALSPSFGRGANLAFEDAYVLAEELASTADVDSALNAFVPRRELRAAFVQAKTAERIELVNRGASQRDLSAARQLVSAHLSSPI